MLNLALEPLFNAPRGCVKTRRHSHPASRRTATRRAHAWPGDVRELENRVGWVWACQNYVCDAQGAVDVARRSKVFPECTDPLALAVPAAAAQPPLKEIRYQTEQQRVREVRESVNGDQWQACEILEISRAAL